MRSKTLRSGRNSTPAKTVHISLDFGSTFSAAAYAINHGNERLFTTTDIKLVSKYPSGTAWNGRDVNDVPTELLYRDGQKEAVAWGWEARNLLKQSKEPHKLRKNYATRFKLLLSLKDNSRAIREDLQQRILRDGRSVIDLIVDYLTPLRKHILSFIQNAEDEEAEFKKWALQWTLTVPADWGPYARRQMKEAAHLAGLEGKIKLISEPEAAALYILEKRAEERKKLTLENAAVVGDLGGGTIDCATYQISGLEPLSLGALAHVLGRIFGSSNLNDGFRRHIETRLEDAIDDYLERDSKLSRDQILDRAVDWFEIEKREFSGSADPRYVPVAWLKEDEKQRFAPGVIEISRDDLLSIFDPIIDQIIEMLNEQIFNSIHYRMKVGVSRSKFRIEKIFLTGGLAANQYVYQRVKVAFENERVHSYPIPVVAPPLPEIAVVFGAVWRSLCPEKITKRVSETSYGFRRDESYSEGWPHGGPGPVTNPLTGAIEVQDRMKWVVKQNEAFRDNDRVPYRLLRYVPVGGSLQFEESLYYSDTVSKDHVHYEEPDIHFLGTLPFDLRRWRDDFDIDTNHRGERYMVIEYDLISIFLDDEWLYEIEVMKNKTKFKGSTNISAALKLSQGAFQD